VSKAELLLDDNFREYRKKEIEEGISFVRQFMNGKCDPEYAKGALEMLKRIILIPKSFTMSEEQKERVNLAIQKDFDDFHFGMIKRYINEE